uniref:Uncharacterized protein n=1 Tax=Anguilla anguilla TaxID=7936 RepID=A0A0E9SRP9_ANGAN
MSFIQTQSTEKCL